ncbi:hypothetical protein SAMN04488123_13610 [Natribacillus halophilus]|uniref:Uncharacterized protein n=1 Tax=Natribacillus halophilus TaxID=549003 RepID=A0A1G8SU95_9BACI|nr:hypothetical protein SAMN04488123_13610 [Natribacillus halophilus]
MSGSINVYLLAVVLIFFILTVFVIFIRDHKVKIYMSLGILVLFFLFSYLAATIPQQ